MKPILFNTEMVRAILEGRKTQTRRVVKLWGNHYVRGGGTFRGDPSGPKYGAELDNHSILLAPYQKGDRLYVRETWAAYSRNYGEAPRLVYKADMNPPDCVKWRPSIHMPREAARIFLRVTDVRAERLWDISSEDVYAEGTDNRLWAATRDAFRRLWDSTIKKADLDRYGWNANPWVWVYTFERITREEAEAALKEGDHE